MTTLVVNLRYEANTQTGTMAGTLEDLQHKVDILLHELVQLQETVEDLKQPIYETPNTDIYIGIKQ